MPITYILKCSDNTLYTGTARDIEKQEWEHQHGQGAYYTKQRLPVKFVYCEEYERIHEALYREKQIQRWTREKKTALIEGRMEGLPLSAKNIFIKTYMSSVPVRSQTELGKEALEIKK